MDPEHRKIELQSPADLTYLTSQIRTLARSKIDQAFPPQPDTSAPDELRTQVEALVEAFVAQILAGMRHNISINGVDVMPRGVVDEHGEIAASVGADEEGADAVIEEFEPFDEKLRRRLGAVVERRDKLVGEVSRQRREVPGAAARRWEERWVKETEEVVERARVDVREEDVEVLGAMKRQEEVERNWERAVEGLRRLNKGLPETRARLERCGEVVTYLGGKKES
ncbi:hypothetical protein BU23DRAFT_589568 [Bimuria novae-zelandiae CBS 107.79]|uniref:Kinetochore protein mis14 n=1 Tax=Bimuria novae-zelandiae CBS 107.79 TaxID=1447943 RepID=A0A6A5V7A0_9PLEO|nr:hypothetical protein BU23DRAFT_589568 [Bimuria novae-zelandiae CBS 107.79]